MNRDDALLQGLRARLSKSLAWVKKTAYAEEVYLESEANSEFALVVKWKDKGEEVVYRHAFTRPYVFGPTYSLSRDAWSVHKCSREFLRDAIREVISRRTGG